MKRLIAALAAILLITGCSDSQPPKTTTTQRTTTTVATVAQEVEAAYLDSWDVYAVAVRTLDPSGLPARYYGPGLDTVRGEIQRRAREHRPARVDVDHDITVDVVSKTVATVLDEYRSRQVDLDPLTGEPVAPVEPVTIRELVTLNLVKGTWKVVDITRIAD